jgi:hypothetical protein
MAAVLQGLMPPAQRHPSRKRTPSLKLHWHAWLPHMAVSPGPGPAVLSLLGLEQRISDSLKKMRMKGILSWWEPWLCPMHLRAE